MNVSEIDRTFKQFVFECMDMKVAGTEGIVTNGGPSSGDNKPSVKPLPIPWDDPYPFFKGMMSKEMEEEEKEEAALAAAPLTCAEDLASGENSHPSHTGSYTTNLIHSKGLELKCLKLFTLI